MLVLSRKENQRVLFPNLGITCEIVKIAGNAVRVGIDAPGDVRILREEIADDQAMQEAEQARHRRHELKNRLNTASLALHLAQKQMNRGLSDQSQQTLERALHEFSELDRLVADESTEAKTSQPEKPPRRILVVEDNPQEREMLAGYLEMYGYDVSTAADGLEAMRWLSHHEQPDAVLLDMQMPRLNGRKTVSAIRCNPAYRGLKLFAVSGDTRAASEVPQGERGVDRWFSKPLQPTQFVEELDARLSRDFAAA